MWDENRFASRIWSSFNNHEVMSAHILHAIYDSLIMKENEHRSAECSFKNTSFYWSSSQWQNSDKWQSNWDYLCIIRSHQEVYFLSKIIELSMWLLKSKLLKSCNEIVMIANCMKNAEYFKSMKWLFEIQQLQKQDH